MSTLLKTEHLKKYYGKKKIVKAVDDVSLEIHAGSSMALIGESGSGKTTFGKLIAGLEKPTDGKFWFQGQEMQELSEKQFRPYRKNLQMVFQSSSGVFDPGYTIGENILESLQKNGIEVLYCEVHIEGELLKASVWTKEVPDEDLEGRIKDELGKEWGIRAENCEILSGEDGNQTVGDPSSSGIASDSDRTSGVR